MILFISLRIQLDLYFTSLGNKYIYSKTGLNGLVLFEH